MTSAKNINLPNDTKVLIESKVLNRLIKHLQQRTDVQNIDLMNLSGFCRNCLSKWYSEAANELGHDLDKNESRHIVYGMPHEEWKVKYQKEANPDQLNKFQDAKD